MGKLLLSLLDNGFKQFLKLYLNSYFPKQFHEKYDFRNSNHLQYCKVIIIGTEKYHPGDFIMILNSFKPKLDMGLLVATILKGLNLLSTNCLVLKLMHCFSSKELVLKKVPIRSIYP